MQLDYKNRKKKTYRKITVLIKFRSVTQLMHMCKYVCHGILGVILLVWHCSGFWPHHAAICAWCAQANTEMVRGIQLRLCYPRGIHDESKTSF